MIPPESEIARIMRDTGMERMQAVNHARAREVLRLSLASPLRSPARQYNADECPLFVVANEPGLL